MRLVQVSNEQAEDNFSQIATTTIPVYYTIWGGVLRLSPDPDTGRTIRLRGYRYPSNWVAGGAGAVIDADPRLHILLAHFAIALCYAQQEDEVLEDVYMRAGPRRGRCSGNRCRAFVASFMSDTDRTDELEADLRRERIVRENLANRLGLLMAENIELLVRLNERQVD